VTKYDCCPVAQWIRAPRSDRGGRAFKSRRDIQAWKVVRGGAQPVSKTGPTLRVEGSTPSPSAIGLTWARRGTQLHFPGEPGKGRPAHSGKRPRPTTRRALAGQIRWAHRRALNKPTMNTRCFYSIRLSTDGKRTRGKREGAGRKRAASTPRLQGRLSGCDSKWRRPRTTQSSLRKPMSCAWQAT
jgi:hypothetical protein